MEPPVKMRMMNNAMTLEEVAEALQKAETKEALACGREPPNRLSRERIRQIEKIALRKLKRIMSAKGLRYEDLMPDKFYSEEKNAAIRRFED